MRKLNLMKTKRLLLAAGAALLLLAHAGLVLRSYPPRLFISGEPPLKGDVDRYYTTAWGAAGAGGLFGYDASSMAGYPVGLWNSMGKKGFEVFHLLLPGLGLPRLFYLVLVGFSLFAPLIAWWAIRGDLASPAARRLLLVLLVAFWQLDTQTAYFWNFGNVFFPATVCLVMVACGVAMRVLGGAVAADDASGRGQMPARPGVFGVEWGWGLLLGVVLSAIFYFHTVVVAAAVVPLVAVVVLKCWRRSGGAKAGAHSMMAPLTRPAMAGLLIAAIVTAVLCLPWLQALLQSRGDCVAQPKEWFQGGLKYLIMDAFSDRAYQHHFDRNFLMKTAVVFGLAGLWILHRRSESVAARALGWGAVASLGIAYGLPLLGLGGSLQPYRFVIPATLLLLPAASEGMCAAAGVVGKMPREAKGVTALLLLLLLPALTASLIDLSWFRGEIGVNESHRKVARWLERRNIQGRVFCDDASLGHVLPTLSGHSVIGGLSSQAFLKHRFAGIDEEGIAFGRPLEDWPIGRLAQYLDAYAVEVLALSRPRHIRYAETATGLLTPAGQVGGYHMFRTRAGMASYARGQMAVVREDGRFLNVTGARDREVVLKYHYAPWLRASDGVSLRPRIVLQDPVPFIVARLPDGVTDFTVNLNPAGRRVSR